MKDHKSWIRYMPVWKVDDENNLSNEYISGQIYPPNLLYF